MSITVHGRKFSIQSSDFDTLTTQENLFSNIWYTKGGYGFDGVNPTGVAATNNNEVGKLNTKNGGVDIIYTGRLYPTPSGQSYDPLEMDHKIPILISDDGQAGKWLSFKNVTSTQYESSTVSGMVPILETWWIGRYWVGQDFEAMFEGFNNWGYVGDNGDTEMRIVNPEYGFLPSSTKPALFTTYVGRLVISSQSTGTLYINNVSQGDLTFQSPDLNEVWKTVFNVGVTTHQSDWDFAAMYFSNSDMSSNATAIYSSLATKWGAGTTPTNQILINSIGYNLSGGTYTPFATVVNTPSGVTVASQSSWDYQWYQDDGDLDRQTLFSTSYQALSSDLNPSLGTHVKVLIRPKDSNGNVWRFFEGTYPE